MLENRFKGEEPEDDEPKIKKTKQTKSLFDWIDSILNLDFLVQKKSSGYLYYIFFIMLIGVVYIGNSHFSEKGHRKLIKLKQKVGNLRTDYTTLKAEYMYATKQTEVMKRAKQIGLIESKNTPIKIKIKKGEH